MEIADNLAVKFGKKEKARGVDVNALKEQLRQELKGAGTGRGAGAQEGQLFQASVALNGGKFDDAAAMYSAILERDGQCAEAYWGKALAAARCKNDAELIRTDAAGYKRALTGDNFRFAIKYARAETADRIVKTMKEMLGRCENTGGVLRAESERLKKNIDELSKKSTRLKAEMDKHERDKKPLPPAPKYREMHALIRTILALLCLGAVIAIIAVSLYLEKNFWQSIWQGNNKMFLIWGAIIATPIIFVVAYWLIGKADDSRKFRVYRAEKAVYDVAAKHNEDIDIAIAALDKEYGEAQVAIAIDRKKLTPDEAELAEWVRYKEYLGTLIDWQKQHVK